MNQYVVAEAVKPSASRRLDAQTPFYGTQDGIQKKEAQSDNLTVHDEPLRCEHHADPMSCKNSGHQKDVRLRHFRKRPTHSHDHATIRRDGSIDGLVAED